MGDMKYYPSIGWVTHQPSMSPIPAFRVGRDVLRQCDSDQASPASESPIRISHRSESLIRVTHPRHPSESPIRVTHPSRLWACGRRGGCGLRGLDSARRAVAGWAAAAGGGVGVGGICTALRHVSPARCALREQSTVGGGGGERRPEKRAGGGGGTVTGRGSRALRAV